MPSTPGAHSPAPPRVNAPDVALIFEGGGMRAAYTSAVVVRLIEAGIVFPFVAGISAGCTNTVNYLSSDRWRAKAAVTTFAGDPQFGNWRTFVRGQGLFNSDYIYLRTSRPGEALPLDYEAFAAHPADVSMTAFRTRDGATVRWGRSAMTDLDAVSVRAQASSTMPVIMPPVEIDGEQYVDGALCTTGGIAIDAAREAGFRRFFVVLTQERGYRKTPPGHARFLRRYFRRTPAVADALIDRWSRYNSTREELFDLESSGEAYLFVPETMAIGNGERSVPRLLAAHERGLNQSTRELPRWRDFLGVS